MLFSSQRRRGAILVGLVVVMVIFAVLAAALLPITASSFFTEVAANNMTRAYYLAEAGYRYAAGQFISVSGEAARDNMIGTVHNKTYNLSGGEGSFKLESYPYFYKVTTPGNTTTLQTKINGGIAANRTIPTSGRLLITDQGSPVGTYNYTNVVLGGSNATFRTATFTLSSPANVAVNYTVLPVAVASAQTMTNGGTLTLSSGADAFPQYRGTFQLVNAGATVYMYEKKVGNELRGITNFNDPAQTFSVSVAANQDVALLKYLELRSTGSLGSGYTATSRLVTYYGPIAAINPDQGLAGSGVPQSQAEQKGDSLLTDLANNSGATSTGRFATTNLGGDTALTITQTTSGSGQGNQPSVEAFVSLPGGAANPIYRSWDGARSYLSYDIQVKVATGDWNAGTNSFTNKPSTYCAGIMFRASTALSNQAPFYGFSLMRSHQGKGNDSDGIKDDMIPGNNENKAMLVLWTRNSNQGNGDDNWLAYKLLDEAGGSDYIVDNSGRVKDWSTLLVRVVEAASLKLTVNDAPAINIGDTITGGSGTAEVFRKINDSDGKVVLLLNKVVGNFSLPTTVGSYTTDATWGYRSRDNYIWAFYTDTSDHSSDATALNNVRLGQTRGTVNWPTTQVQNWDAAGDKFTLVNWNASLNTDQDSTLRIMGTGKEANGIIRTNKWTTGSY
ncbi:MAG: type II secretion system GspH family protein, partial [Syntrophales bacterium]|nr:type II secretion system GspH family protein [Syntrophales bacterium]